MTILIDLKLSRKCGIRYTIKAERINWNVGTERKLLSRSFVIVIELKPKNRAKEIEKQFLF